jgi:tetratricopeptide (TPR) repeat protein
LLEMRRTQPAIAQAREVAARADALAYPPVRAEAALVLGRALAADDGLTEAIAELRRAYFVAMSCGHARTQAKAATELVYAVGYLQQNHGQGREWAEHALAIVARIDEGGLIEADAHHSLGVLLDSAGDHTGSLAAYERAYELRKALLPAVHPDLARSLNAIANIQHSLGHFDRSREGHGRALEMRITLYGPDHPAVAGSLNNLSLTLRDMGELEQAKQQLERAVGIVERLSGTHGNGLPRSLTNLAEIERRLGNYPRAREIEERSLAIRRATVGDAHPEVADSILGVARIALAEGQLEQAEVLARDGLARLRRDFAIGHPEIFAATLVLAEVLEAKAEGDEAARLLVGALADSRVEELEAVNLAQARALLERLGR